MILGYFANGKILVGDQKMCFYMVLFMPRHKKWRGIMLYPPNF